MNAVSVVITTYNRQCELLKRAIESVLNQTFKDFELIIVNDAPENEDLQNEIQDMIISCKDKRIKYYVNDKNKGANYSRNRGIELASYDYIAFLDDDDTWKYNKLEVQYAAMEDGVALVTCNSYIINEGKVKERRTRFNPENALHELLKRNCVGETSLPLLRKDAVISCGKFDEYVVQGQELDLWIRLAQNYKLKKVEDFLVEYYVSSDSSYRNPQKYIRGVEGRISKYRDYYENDKVAYNYLLNDAAFYLLANYGEIKLFSEYWVKAIKVRLISPVNLRFIPRFIKHKIDSFFN